MTTGKSYQTEEINEEDSLKYLFISQGKSDIIKAIEYRYIQDFNGNPLFNLGFGDYDIETDKTSDHIISNNGDMYSVFNTVLGTIPGFFDFYPNGVMMVQGSDSGAEFLELCKLNCRKKCEGSCRNSNRRINTYRYYVEKNFEALNAIYAFLGGLKNAAGQIIPEPYQIGKKYDSVFCSRK